jgi:bacterioferritin-associated ferredoxin
VIVCVCKGVSDRRIRAEAAAGHSLDEVLRRTGAGSSCGQCRFAIARIVHAEHAAAQAAEQVAKQDAA